MAMNDGSPWWRTPGSEGTHQDTCCGVCLGDPDKRELLKEDTFMALLHLCHSAQIFEP